MEGGWRAGELGQGGEVRGERGKGRGGEGFTAGIWGRVLTTHLFNAGSLSAFMPMLRSCPKALAEGAGAGAAIAAAGAGGSVGEAVWVAAEAEGEFAAGESTAAARAVAVPALGMACSMNAHAWSSSKVTQETQQQQL